jgi:hypothetical protein
MKEEKKVMYEKM